jgi:hypothetical protein
LLWNGRRRRLIGFSILAILLMLTHYLPYAGLMTAIGIDYIFFERRRNRLPWWDVVWFLGVQFLAAIVAVWIWNPLNKGVVPDFADRSWLIDKLTLVWWNFRDLNACEFGAGLLLLVAPILYFFDRNRWLLRCWLAIVVYCVIVAFLSPQPAAVTYVADIRYVSAIIPLCIFLMALEIVVLSRGKWYAAIPIAALVFGTNIVHQPWKPSSWRSTTYQWLEELCAAPTTSVRQAADWINENVKPEQSVLVGPIHMSYSLMYHAPHAVYAWQIKPPPEGDFKDLPIIHFFGEGAPEYILSYGPSAKVESVVNAYREQKQINYVLVAKLDTTWDERIRPELFWHRFKPLSASERPQQVIYIWKRDDFGVPPPAESAR